MLLQFRLPRPHAPSGKFRHDKRLTRLGSLALAVLLMGCTAARSSRREFCASSTERPACSRCTEARYLDCRKSPVTEERARVLAERFVREQGFTDQPADSAVVRRLWIDPIAPAETVLSKRRNKLQSSAANAHCGRQLEGYDWAVEFPARGYPTSLLSFVVYSDESVDLRGGGEARPPCTANGHAAEEVVLAAQEFIRTQGYASAAGDPQKFRWEAFSVVLEGDNERAKALVELQNRRGMLEDDAFGVVCPSTWGKPSEWLVVFRYADHSKTDILADDKTNQQIGPVGRAVVVPASEPPYMKHTGWPLARVDQAICR
jgi:hypothetical protein